jgi:hypothetical protein
MKRARPTFKSASQIFFCVLLRPNLHAPLSPPRFQRLTSSLMHSWPASPGYNLFCAFSALPIPKISPNMTRRNKKSYHLISSIRQVFGCTSAVSEDRALLRTHLERRRSLANGGCGRFRATRPAQGRSLPEQAQGQKSQEVRGTESRFLYAPHRGQLPAN